MLRRSSARKAQRLGHGLVRPFVECLESRTTPSFGAAVTYAVDNPGWTALVADFNSDGQADLAAPNYSYPDGAVSVLLGNGDGSFQPALTSPAGPLTFDLAAGDFNNDAIVDLVTLDDTTFSSTIVARILLGNGDGTFQSPLSQSVEFGGSFQNGSCVVGDVNADGNDDFIVGWEEYYGDVDFLVWLGNGDGTFAEPLPGLADPTGFFYPDLRLADFNEDGNLDLLGSHGLLAGNGDGTFSFGTGVHQGAVGDLNADGHLDIAATYYSSGFQVAVYFGDGSGGFASPTHYAMPTGSTNVSMGDIDNDGDLDVVTNNDNGTASVLRNQGDGTLDSAQHFSAGAGAVADFNADGYADLALANGGSHVFVYLNNAEWPARSLSIADVSVTEGNTGSLSMIFTVTLSAASSETVTVNYATANGTASAGSDYTAISGTLSFTPGQTTRTITVAITGDRLGEVNETLVVNLTQPTHAAIADSQAVGTILDNEPRISISDVTMTEGKKNQNKTFTFTVTLSAAYDQAVTVSYQTANGTATTANNDYVAKSGTITFNPGQTTMTITITVKGDNVAEANEFFYVDLFNNSSNSLITKNRGVGTILNDD